MEPAVVSAEQDTDDLQASGNQIENRFYRLTVDPETGAVSSIYDKILGRELVNRQSSWRFNSVWLSSSGRDRMRNAPTGKPRVTAARNAVAARLLIERHDSPCVRTDYALLRGLRRIEVRNAISRHKVAELLRSQLSRQGPYYAVRLVLTMPFRIDPAELAVWSQRDTFLLPCSGSGHLPGSFAQAFYAQHVLGLDEGGRFGVLVAPRQNFVFTVVHGRGEPRQSRRWAPTEATLLIPLYALNSPYPTKGGGRLFVDVEPAAPDLLRYEFAITTHAGSGDGPGAVRFGYNYNVPLIGRIVGSNTTGVLRKPAASLASVDPKNVFMVVLKPADFTDGFVLRLQEFSGRRTAARVRLCRRPRIVRALDLLERSTGISLPAQRNIEVRLRAHETITLGLEF